jgi:hypothetical protein
MARALVAVIVLFASGATVVACGKDEPPPQPLGCKQAKVVFEKIEAGFVIVAKRTAGMDTTTYCTKLQAATKAANALSFALLAESFGEGTKAKAAAAVRQHTKGLLAGADAVATKCPQEGVAGTQAALAAQLAKAHAAVDKSCSE